LVAVVAGVTWTVATPLIFIVAVFADPTGTHGLEPRIIGFHSLPVLAAIAAVIGILGAAKSRLSWIVLSSALPIAVFLAASAAP
jgi:hypothetical protein